MYVAIVCNSHACSDHLTDPIDSFPNVRACLFDMDGLLIDSEDIYTLCNNVILHQYGKPSLPWNIKAQLQGRPGPEVSVFSLHAIRSLTSDVMRG